MLRDALLQTLDVRRGHRGRGEHARGASAHRRPTSRTSRRSSSRWSACTSRRALPGREDLAFHLAIYDATHNPLFRQLLGADARGLRALLGQARSTGRISRAAPFRSTASSSTRSAAGDPEAARAKTLAILTIVEEDIEDMSQ